MSKEQFLEIYTHRSNEVEIQPTLTVSYLNTVSHIGKVAAQFYGFENFKVKCQTVKGVYVTWYR